MFFHSTAITVCCKLGVLGIVACALLIGCGTGQAPSSQPSHKVREVRADAKPDQAVVSDGTVLSVQLELELQKDVPTIFYDQPFRVVLINNSERAIRVRNPRTQAGDFQVMLRFTNPLTGETLVVRKQRIENADDWRANSDDFTPGTETVEIASHESLTSEIWLSEIQGERTWSALPDPLACERYLVEAQFESDPETTAESITVWAGKSLSDAVSARFVAQKIKTPHHCLCNGFPTAAIRLMTTDPKWIGACDKSQCTPLHHAARYGHVDVVQWLLEHGADVNAIAYNGFTPLHLTDHLEVIELILRHKPDLTIRSMGATPLQHASEKQVEARGALQKEKWRRIVNAYLTAGTDYDAITAIRLNDFDRLKAILKESPQLADNFDDESLLRTAASLGRLEMCEYLIGDFRVDIDDFERGVGFPIIKTAVEFPQVVKLLIAHGADLKTRITWRGGQSGVWIIGDDATVLHHAAVGGVPETITQLIDGGIDVFAEAKVHHAPDWKQTALEVAAFFGKAANAEAIVKHPKFDTAAPELRQQLLDKCLLKGAAPSWLARDAQRPQLVQVLLEKGANPNVSQGGLTPMLVAAREIHPNSKKENAEIKRIIGHLIERGAVVDLFSAVAIGNLDQVQTLLERDPKLASTRASDGYPALHFAVDMDYREIVAALLKAGCDVDLRNQCESTGNKNGTALHSAAFWRREEIARSLIAAGANVNAVAENQTTPLDEAHRLNSEKVARLLREHGAKPGDGTDR